MDNPRREEPPPLPPAVIDYGNRQPLRSDTWFVTPLVRGIAFAAVIHLLLGAVSPHFEGIFKDFKLQLPGTTIALLTASRFYRESGGWLLLLPLACVPLLVAALTRGGRNRIATIAYSLLMGAMVLWFALAIFQPYVSLMQGVAGSGTKR